MNFDQKYKSILHIIKKKYLDSDLHDTIFMLYGNEIYNKYKLT